MFLSVPQLLLMVGRLNESKLMATYEITAPDGQTYEITAPEGASQDQVLAYAKANYSKAATPAPEVQRGRPTMANDPRRLDQAAPLTDSSLLSQGYGLLKGAVIDPLLGAAQLASKASPFLPIGPEKPDLVAQMTGKTTTQRIQDIINAEQQVYEKSRQASGREGFDVPVMAGAILSPVNKLTGGVGLIGTGALQGAIQPVSGTGEDYLATKAVQVGVGAMLGPLLESGVKLSAKALDQLKVVTESGKVQAVKDYLDELIPADKRAKVIQALQSVQEIVPGSKPTAAQALVNTPEGQMLSAVERNVGKTSVPLQTQYRAQEAARQAELGTISGTEAERKALEQSRGQLFGKYAQPALDANDTVRMAYQNIEKAVMGKVPQLVQSAEELQAGQQAQLNALMTGQGPMPTPIPVKQQLTEQAQQKLTQLKAYQKESLAATGIFPLEVGSLVDKLNKAIKGTTSDESKKVLEGVKEDLINKADNNGLISSADLYENVRKVMNQNINRYLNQGQQAYQGGIPQQAAATGENVKKLIDTELNKSSNGLWSKYLEEYTTHSRKLDRMAVGQALQDKLGTPLQNKETAAAFAQAVADSASLIKKNTGQPRYTQLNQLLTEEEMGSVNKVMADLVRQEKAIAQGKSVNAPGFVEEAPGKDINALTRAVTLAKGVLHALSRGGKEQFNEKMAALLADPNALAMFMQSGPISGQRKLAEAINKRLNPETQRALLQAIGVQGITKQLGEQPSQ